MTMANGLVRIRVVSLNVEFGARTNPQRLAQAFKPLRPDIIGLCEVPEGDWSARVGRELGLEHVYVGAVSSAHHKDKYKSILSRTSLRATCEREFREGSGWNPASIVWAETDVASGMTIGIGSLHICENQPDASGRLGRRGHSHALREFLADKRARPLIIMGDFNNCLGDPALEFLAEAGVRSTWRDLNVDLKTAFTYSAVGAERLGLIDHITYAAAGPNTARAIDGGIVELQTPVADHKPIWAEIEFRPTPSSS